MNKIAQADWGEIIKFILIAPILLAFIGAIVTIMNPPDCPTCDCSSYQNQLQECQNLTNNLSKQINETPVKYIQNTTYIEVPIEKIVYKEKLVPVIINIVALILSIGLTFTLFKIEIKLPKELEAKIMKIEKLILWTKWGSFILTLIIFVRLLFALF